jgi:glycosyltransferase involved in cell wall biosynthesis
MRILMTAHTFLPASRGGMENHIYYLARHLLSRGHEVGVVYRIHDPTREEYEVVEDEWEGISVWQVVHNFTDPIPTPHGYYNRPIEDRVLRLVERFRPDVVHFHHLAGLSTSLPGALRRTSAQTVWTLHDFWPLCYLSSLRTPDGRLCPGPDGGVRCVECLWLEHRPVIIPDYFRRRTEGLGPAALLRQLPWALWDTFMELVLRSSQLRLRQKMLSLTARDVHMRQVLANVDLLISPSRFLIEIFAAWGIPAERFRHVPNSVAPALLVHWRPADTPLHDPLAFGFLGRLFPYKGAHVLVEAFRTLPPEQATLRIWGDPPVPDEEGYYPALRASAGDAPHISFEGAFSPEALGDVLDQIDVLIIPSIWYENNPLVILEAFAAGIPVVAGDVGGMAELVAHDRTGLLFRTGDAADLAAKLDLLIREPARIERYRSHIEPPWTMEEMGAAVEQIYHQLVGQAG